MRSTVFFVVHRSNSASVCYTNRLGLMFRWFPRRLFSSPLLLYLFPVSNLLIPSSLQQPLSEATNDRLAWYNRTSFGIIEDFGPFRLSRLSRSGSMFWRRKQKIVKNLIKKINQENRNQWAISHLLVPGQHVHECTLSCSGRSHDSGQLAGFESSIYAFQYSLISWNNRYFIHKSV